MRLRRTIYVARVDGKPRVLFSILEKRNGELIIPIRTSERYGSDYSTASPILEQRISIHPSLKSGDYTTIKQTTSLADGCQITSVALTDAVKHKTGFSLIFVRRAPNMSPEKYLLLESDKKDSALYELPPTDPLKETLYYGILVGSPEVDFKAKDSKLLIMQHCYKRFRLVLMATWFKGSPAHHTSEFMHVLTTDPEMATNAVERLYLRQFMKGKPDHVCIIQFMNGAYSLAKRLFEVALAELTIPELIERVKEEIKILEQKILPIALDKEPRAIQRQIPGKPVPR